MKRKLVFLLTWLFAFSCAGVSFAGIPALDDPSVRTAKFWVGKKEYTVNGESRSMDVSPYVKGGRTFLPVRFAADSVGADDIKWDPKAKKVTITKNGSAVVFTIGSRSMAKGGKTINMDAAPEITNGRTMLPIRWVGEAFDAAVIWDSRDKMVTINSGRSIDYAAALSGTLEPPADAKAPDSVKGFKPQAKRIDFKLGSRYATVTRLDGSTYTLDLGTEVVLMGPKAYVDEHINYKPSVYNNKTCVADETITNEKGNKTCAFYIPAIPVMEAFGVPKENIVWDGKHLAVFGVAYWGDKSRKDNYQVIKADSKEYAYRGNGGRHTTWKLFYPLKSRDGAPVLAEEDLACIMLLNPAPGVECSLVDSILDDCYFNLETGKGAISVEEWYLQEVFPY